MSGELKSSLTVSDELFKEKIEDKILERFNRYISRILEIKNILKDGFKSEQDFKNFFHLSDKMENENDLLNVKIDVQYYYSLRQLINCSFK